MHAWTKHPRQENEHRKPVALDQFLTLPNCPEIRVWGGETDQQSRQEVQPDRSTMHEPWKDTYEILSSRHAKLEYHAMRRMRMPRVWIACGLCKGHVPHWEGRSVRIILVGRRNFGPIRWKNQPVQASASAGMELWHEDTAISWSRDTFNELGAHRVAAPCLWTRQWRTKELRIRTLTRALLWTSEGGISLNRQYRNSVESLQSWTATNPGCSPCVSSRWPIPYAKAAVDKDQHKHRSQNISFCNTHRILCHLENDELDKKSQKHTKAVLCLRWQRCEGRPRLVCCVHQAGIFRVARGSCPSSMDVISRLPGCTGQASDCSLCTHPSDNGGRSKVEWMRFPKLGMSDHLDSSTSAPMSEIVRAKFKILVVPHERNLFGHPIGRIAVGATIWKRSGWESGWEEVPGWECSVHTLVSTGLFLSVMCVDDYLELTEKKNNLKSMWEKLDETSGSQEEPTPLLDQVYFGGAHSVNVSRTTRLFIENRERCSNLWSQQVQSNSYLAGRAHADITVWSEQLNVRRSILKKSGKGSPRTHLSLRYTRNCRKISSTFGNSWDHLWVTSRVELHIIAAPMRLFSQRQRSELHVVGRRRWKKKQLGSGANQLFRTGGTYLEREDTYFSPKSNVE